MGWLYIQQIANLWMGTLMLFVFLLLGLLLEKDELKQLLQMTIQIVNQSDHSLPAYESAHLQGWIYGHSSIAPLF